MKHFFSILFVGLLSWTTDAASWYIDSTASGANNGTSWANAWQSLPAVTWGSANPGDTIYISGGPAGGTRTYGGFVDPNNDSVTTQGRNGTSANPITFTVGSDPAHNGIVIFDGASGGDGFSYFNFYGLQYWVVDGQSAGDGQRHFALMNFFDTSERTRANKIYADTSIGCVFKFLAFTNVNQCVSVVGAQYFRVANCIGDDIRGDAAVRAVNSFPDAWDVSFIENNAFTLSYNTNGHGLLGPDGVQGSHGLTVRNNVFTTKKVGYDTSTQHPDYTQIIGNHLKVYGNEFRNIGDSGHDFDWWANPNPHDIRIYNNVYHITDPTDPLPEYIRWYASAGNSITSIQNILIANNTFVDDSTWANVLCTWGASGNPTLSGWVIANNLFVHGGAYSIADNPSISGNSLGFQNNVYDPAYSFGYRGTTYSASSWSAVENSRIVGVPTFVSYTPGSAGNDFHLSGSDTVARGAGVDLSAFFTTDKDGNTRTTWDAGAYAYNATGTPPNTPSITSIPDGSTGVILTPTIYGSTYSDPNGNAQTDAQFQVYAADGVTVVWDSGSALGMVNFVTVPGAVLNYSTSYKCACRYKSTLGLWSSWSAKPGFTTLAAPVSGPGSGTWNVGVLGAGSVNVQQ